MVQVDPGRKCPTLVASVPCKQRVVGSKDLLAPATVDHQVDLSERAGLGSAQLKRVIDAVPIGREYVRNLHTVKVRSQNLVGDLDGIFDSAHRISHDKPCTEVADLRCGPLNIGPLNDSAARNAPVRIGSVAPLAQPANRLSVQAERCRYIGGRYREFRSKFCRKLKTVALPTDVVVGNQPGGIGINQ